MTGALRPESAGDNHHEWTPEDWRLNYEAVETQNAMLHDAVERLDVVQWTAAALVAKLDLIAPHLSGQAAFLYVHGQRYDGPNYAAELEALRAVLARLETV